jgi:hypothetical protein
MNWFKKFPDPFKKNKKRKHTSRHRQESNMTMTTKLNIDNGLQGQTKEHQAVTGVCCQWRDSGSYDSDVDIETFVLRRKFSGKIATEQQPPNRYQQA